MASSSFDHESGTSSHDSSDESSAEDGDSDYEDENKRLLPQINDDMVVSSAVAKFINSNTTKQSQITLHDIHEPVTGSSASLLSSLSMAQLPSLVSGPGPFTHAYSQTAAAQNHNRGWPATRTSPLHHVSHQDFAKISKNINL